MLFYFLSMDKNHNMKDEMAEKLSTSNIDESEDEDRAISVDIYVRHYKGEFPFSGEAHHTISYQILSYHIL